MIKGGGVLTCSDQNIRVDAMHVTQGNIVVLVEGSWVSLVDLVGDNNYLWTCSICKTVNAHGLWVCRNYKNHPK